MKYTDEKTLKFNNQKIVGSTTSRLCVLVSKVDTKFAAHLTARLLAMSSRVVI